MLAVQELALVTVTEYAPVAFVVTLVIEGFCWVEEKEFGPDQKYVNPPDEVRCKVLPGHRGPLLLIVTTGGLFIPITIVSKNT